MSVIGDRWSLMILRDCFMKVRRFDDFHDRLGIGRPILTDRLKKLVDNFVLTKVAYQQNPMRYEYRLTQKGLDLYPVIIGIIHWGDIHMGDRKGRPLLHHHVTCGNNFEPLLTCSECSEPVYPGVVTITPGPGAREAFHLPPGTAQRMRAPQTKAGKLWTSGSRCRPANVHKAPTPTRSTTKPPWVVRDTSQPVADLSVRQTGSGSH